MLKHAIYNLIDRSLFHSFTKKRKIDYERIAYWKAASESADFMVSEMSTANHVRKKRELLEMAIREISVSGMWLEFGVYEGRDINFIGRQTKQTVYGFDSFEGLPEDWTHFQKKGQFNLKGKCPENMPENVEFVKGWFDQTLPDFLSTHKEPIAFLHVDSDLYSSAKTIFELAGDRLIEGSVILFDDFLNYPNWKNGESKAFFEFAEASQKKFQYVGFASSHHSVLVKMLS